MVAVLEKAVSEGELEDVRSHLPEDEEYDELFKLVQQEGRLPE